MGNAEIKNQNAKCNSKFKIKNHFTFLITF